MIISIIKQSPELLIQLIGSSITWCTQPHLLLSSAHNTWILQNKKATTKANYIFCSILPVSKLSCMYSYHSAERFGWPQQIIITFRDMRAKWNIVWFWTNYGVTWQCFTGRGTYSYEVFVKQDRSTYVIPPCLHMCSNNCCLGLQLHTY